MIISGEEQEAEHAADRERVYDRSQVGSGGKF